MNRRADLAARVLAVLARDTGRTDADLAGLTGADPADLSAVIGMLYRRGTVDRCGPYVVAVPGRPASFPGHALDASSPDRQDKLLQAAFGYAARGLPVFWLGPSRRPPGNCPACDNSQHEPAACGHLTCHGFYAATTDPERITAARRTVRRAVLAIRTGTVSGLAVVDIDPRNGGRIDTGLMTATAAVATGGGGWHLYYRHPGHPLPAGLPGHPGVDIKADGGYVVAPPSVHPGTGMPYQWANHRPVSEMPPALRAALTPPPQPVPAPLRAVLPAREGGGISSPAALLAAHLRAVQRAPEGKRRVTLYGAARGAARMVIAGAITEHDARATLTAAGQAAGQTGRDIRAAINGGFQDEGTAR